jgi:site-specific recombinase XerD
MNVEALLGFQVLADIVLFGAIISLVITLARESGRRAKGFDREMLDEFRKAIEDSQKAAEFLHSTMNEGRKSLRDISYSLDQKEKRLRKLINESGTADTVSRVAEGPSSRSAAARDTAAMYERVVTLARQGISEKDIAESLDMSEGEIDLVLGLGRKKIENG